MLDVPNASEAADGVGPNLRELRVTVPTLQDMLPKELQTVAVNLYGTPGMRFDQFGKAFLQLLGGEPVGAAIVILSNPAHGAGIDINGALTETLKLQGSEMAFVQIVASLLFAGFRDKLLCHLPRTGRRGGYSRTLTVPPCSGFVQRRE